MPLLECAVPDSTVVNGTVLTVGIAGGEATGAGADPRAFKTLMILPYGPGIRFTMPSASSARQIWFTC